MSKKLILAFLLGVWGLAGTARAQMPPLPPYGPPIGLAAAQRAAAAAIATAEKNKFVPYSVAIVDSGGNLVLFERMDQGQYGSIRIAIAKARSAVRFKRPTKVFDELLAKGRTTLLALHGIVPSEGGVPIISGGKIIGAIGASGGTAQQDGIVAGAGAATVK
jgi:glc operon protein GlcG